MSDYHDEELLSIYELGRMYYEMGYFVPAERIFQGLLAVDGNNTPARLGLGLLKLEHRAYPEAIINFKTAVQNNHYPIQAKLGLACSFIGLGEIDRAKQLLLQLAPELETNREISSELRALWEMLALRCDG